MKISPDITFGKDNGLGRRYVIVGTIAKKRQNEREPFVLPTEKKQRILRFLPILPSR